MKIVFYCGHAFKYPDPENIDFQYRHALCFYCVHPEMTDRTLGWDPSNPKAPRFRHPGCCFIGRFIVTQHGPGAGFRWELSEPYVRLFHRQLILYSGRTPDNNIIVVSSTSIPWPAEEATGQQ